MCLRVEVISAMIRKATAVSSEKLNVLIPCKSVTAMIYVLGETKNPR
jgi:hypothetical protein